MRASTKNPTQCGTIRRRRRESPRRAHAASFHGARAGGAPVGGAGVGGEFIRGVGAAGLAVVPDAAGGPNKFIRFEVSTKIKE